MRRLALVLALLASLFAPSIAQAVSPNQAPVGGLQEVPLTDLLTDRGGVCSAHPVILVKNFGPGSDPGRYLDAAGACGARVLAYGSGILPHPALYGYLTAKEPSLIGVSGAELRRRYAASKKADPTHPVVVLFTDLAGLGTARNPLTRGMADVVMFDWYPVRRHGYRAGSCATLARAAQTARSVGATVWVMVQTHRYDAGGKAQPTSAQLRRQVAEAKSCAGASVVIAHIWAHKAYQSDLRRNPALFRTFLEVTR